MNCNLVPADSPTRYRCTVCGKELTINASPEKHRTPCLGTPEQLLESIRAELRSFYAKRPFADIDGACERLADCVLRCRLFAGRICQLHAGECRDKRRWFGRLITGTCDKLEAKEPCTK